MPQTKAPTDRSLPGGLPVTLANSDQAEDHPSPERSDYRYFSPSLVQAGRNTGYGARS